MNALFIAYLLQRNLMTNLTELLSHRCLPPDKKTFLHSAAEAGDREFVDVLVGVGAAIDMRIRSSPGVWGGHEGVGRIIVFILIAIDRYGMSVP